MRALPAHPSRGERFTNFLSEILKQHAVPSFRTAVMPPRPLSLPLPPPPPVARKPAPAPPPRARAAPAALWAAIHLPALPLEALGLVASDANPVAVIESEAPRAAVVAASAGAHAAGIDTGMTVGAAAARCAGLALHIRDPAREAAALEGLAAWGERFTPAVSLEPPDALLLEVGGSLRLFGGERALRDRLQAELESAGHAPRLALAPTSRAALWLARSHAATASADQLPGALGRLPIATLRLPERASRDLERLGVHTLREIFRLPRDGLARRFGPALVQDWDRALGHLPEVRRHWQPEQRFAAERELPLPLREIGLMQPFIECLLSELTKTLRRHDAGIDGLTLIFKHERPVPPTVINLRLSATSRGAAHFNRLVNTRLERVRLPTPATALHLESNAFRPVAAQTAALIEEPAAPADGLDALVEVLRARLGREAVFSLAPVADHRPERAWRRVEPGAAISPDKCVALTRPMWLLSCPAPLGEHAGMPLHKNRPLTLVGGPERLEGGWWDESDISRDYYLARAADGARLWVFRGRREKRWFLHGYFA